MSFGRRKFRVGRVISDRMDKSVVVVVEWRQRHPIYQKAVRRRAHLKVHDEENYCKVGDLVRIIETRPLSRAKRWRVTEVLAREEIAEVQPEQIAVEEVALVAVPEPPVHVPEAEPADEVEPIVEAAPVEVAATADLAEPVAEAEALAEQPPAVQIAPLEAEAVEPAPLAEEPELAEEAPSEAEAAPQRPSPRRRRPTARTTSEAEPTVEAGPAEAQQEAAEIAEQAAEVEPAVEAGPAEAQQEAAETAEQAAEVEPIAEEPATPRRRRRTARTTSEDEPAVEADPAEAQQEAAEEAEQAAEIGEQPPAGPVPPESDALVEQPTSAADQEEDTEETPER